MGGVDLCGLSSTVPKKCKTSCSTDSFSPSGQRILCSRTGERITATLVRDGGDGDKGVSL